MFVEDRRWLLSASRAERPRPKRRGDQDRAGPLAGIEGWMRLGKLIAKWRFLHEINLRDMAAEIGIGTSTLQRLEGRAMPDAATLIILMNWLFATEAATNAKGIIQLTPLEEGRNERSDC